MHEPRLIRADDARLRWVRKAMTSCLVTASISSMRADVEGHVTLPSRPLRHWRLGITPSIGLRIAGMGLDFKPDPETGLRVDHRATMSGRE